MKSIVLIGMMGTGKSSIGDLLAQNLNLKFIDIDLLIEKNTKTSISQIFKNQGEQYFRQLEKDTIKTSFVAKNLIISLGGGAFENKETRDFLLSNSTVIYLKTSPETIFSRIKDDKTRPLLCDNMSVDIISKILNTREKNYKTASITISTDNKTPIQIVEEIKGIV